MRNSTKCTKIASNVSGITKKALDECVTSRGKKVVDRTVLILLVVIPIEKLFFGQGIVFESSRYKTAFAKHEDL